MFVKRFTNISPMRFILISFLTLLFCTKMANGATPESVSPDSLDIKIGQMILIGIQDRTSLEAEDDLKEEIKTQVLGGIILFEKNINKENSRENLKQLIKDLQAEASVPLFIAIDEEGGKVHRLKEKYGFVPMPSAAYLGKLNKLDSTYFYSKRLADELASLGINFNFAPTVDVDLNPKNPIISKYGRSYSAKPQQVINHSSEFVKAHRQVHVLTALKHFPGHGSASSDTHTGITDVTKQWKTSELKPFIHFIEKNEADAIITAHIINCNLDKDCLPSTLSEKVIQGLLRDSLGYNGVVISDDMQMYAISKNFGMENAIKMAINAGVDVLVFGNNVNKSDRITATEIHTIIKSQVLSKEIPEERINEAYQRIMDSKKRFK